jgi:hypothetical protein
LNICNKFGILSIKVFQRIYISLLAYMGIFLRIFLEKINRIPTEGGGII